MKKFNIKRITMNRAKWGRYCRVCDKKHPNKGYMYVTTFEGLPKGAEWSTYLVNNHYSFCSEECVNTFILQNMED